jgi:hypothetical protein
MRTSVYIAFFNELEKLSAAQNLTPPKPPKPSVPSAGRLQKAILKPKTQPQPQYIPQRPALLPAPQGQTSTLQPIVNVGQ